LRNRLARAPARHHGAVADHEPGRAGFCVQQGAGVVDRQDDQGNRGETREAKDELARRHNCHRPPCAQLRTGAGDPVFQRYHDLNARARRTGCPAFAGYDKPGYFDSEILAARNWLSAFMAICCLLPVVFSAMLELKPAAWAITWKLPLAPRPWMLPPIFRLVSLQLPVTSPPCATTAASRLNR